MACAHPAPIPLGRRKQHNGTTTWSRLGDACEACGAIRVGGQDAPWISAAAIARLARQVACPHDAGVYATYRRGEVQRNARGTKVQPYVSLGAACERCGADLLRAPPGPLPAVAAARVAEIRARRRRGRTGGNR